MAQEEAKENNKDQKRVKRDVDRELDQFESKLAELRIHYEQHFSGILPLKPDKMHEEVVRTLRNLLKAPFHNSASRFRMRMLSHRYQSFNTYWERVLKQKENGTYRRDVKLAEQREQSRKELKKENTADKRLKELYNSYEEAVRKTGVQQDKLTFDAFKKTVSKTAREFKEHYGAQTMRYKIVVSDGKVVVKASAKE